MFITALKYCWFNVKTEINEILKCYFRKSKIVLYLIIVIFKCGTFFQENNDFCLFKVIA